MADAGDLIEAYGKVETVNGVPERLSVGVMRPVRSYIKIAGMGD